MLVWVVEYGKSIDNSNLVIFDNKTSAEEFVVEKLTDRLNYLQTNDPNLSKDSRYISILECINDKDIDLAIDKYHLFNHGLSDKYYIYLMQNPVKSGSPYITMNVSITSAAPKQKSPDVPCKVCKRNVSADEDVCWYCQVKNPAVK